ncbi:hypothetical protein AAF712_016618 [Marasmius tenuissimus]|uniref:Uncharacterized protein n=1 Tax=Marasmius tenuissimus TaxID=585030 RepID=A0ABR2Z8F9_9AGAR
MHNIEKIDTIASTITIAQIRQNPTLLTRNSHPGQPLRSYEGVVGGIINNILVTSPNMPILYRPPLNECRVHMRHDRHFGPDDPLHYPQPWNRTLAHLAVIRVQSEIHEEPDIDTAWLIPSAQEFVQSPGCGGLGRLDRRIREHFTVFCHYVLNKFPPDAKDVDRIVGEGSIHLNRLLERLDSPASESQTFLHLACAQRQALELLARFDWVKKYRDIYMGKDQSNAPTADSSIVGAFVENLDELDNLFHAGIPVWYLRRFEESPDIRIDAEAYFINNISTQKLPLRFGGELDTCDDTPPRPVLYTGLAGKPECYLCMLNYIRSLFQYPSILGSSEVRSSTSVIRSTRMTGPPGPFSAVAGTQVRSTASRHSKPYSSKPSKHGNATIGDANVVNPFIDASPLLPPSVPAWSDALLALSHHNLSVEPPPGQIRGYFVPPPRLLVMPVNDDTKLRLIRNWLKVRDIVKFHISSSPRHLTAKDWRSFLDISGGDSKQVSSSTATGKRHNTMLEYLKEFLRTHRLSFEYGDLSSLPACWHNETLSDACLPEKAVVQEITWELCELGFRQDLVALDTKLDESNMVTWERQNLLDSCWRGQADSVGGFEGLGSVAFESRIPYLRSLHKVLSTWQGEKPMELLDAFPTQKNVHNYVEKCQCVERAVATFYTLSCLVVLGREALVPHLPPTYLTSP